MKTRGYVSLLLALIMLGAALRPALSQEQKKPDDTIKITAELVQVDVLVSDHNNKPVAGLKREDFELYDNDKPQTIGFFSYEESKLRQVEAAMEGPRNLPRAITPANLRRVITFVVDTLHINSENLYRTKRMLTKFIDTKMEPGDLVLVLATGGGSGIYQQFTTDQRLLRVAVNHLSQPFILNAEGPARRGGSDQAVMSSLLPRLPENDASARPGGANTGLNTGDPLEETDVRASLAALESAIDAMRRFPGRKIGVFISEGLRTFRTQATSILTETTYRAARANVVFYSIDPGGLSPQNFSASDATFKEKQVDTTSAPGDSSPTGFVETSAIQKPSDGSLGRKRDDYFESQDALNHLAIETGGKFYRNNNDIERGLTNLLEENSGYYLLGFQPEGGRWDGKFHKIKVVVRNRPDLVVTTRKGYLAKTEKPPVAPKESADPRVADFVAAFSSPFVRRDIDLRLTPFYRDDARHDPRLTSLIHIEAAELHFTQSGSDYKDKLTLTGVLLDRSGKVADSFSYPVELNYPAPEYQAVRRDGLLVIRGISLKPGVYQMRVLVREAESGIIGTASSFIEIPDWKQDRLAVSSLFTDAQLMQDRKADAVGSAGSLAVRRFPRNGEFAYVTIIYNAKAEGGKTQLEINSKIFRNGELVFAGQPKPVDILEGSTPPGRIMTGNVIQLKGLPPDEYTLEVTVTDKLRKKETGVARQEIDFRVE